jgi:hypothetical protein
VSNRTSEVLDVLRADGDVVDPNGHATAKLFERVTFDTSAVVFSQLLAKMERDGLIGREIAGKRTYAIRLLKRPISPGSPKANGSDTRQTAHSTADPVARGLDYDSLARSLLKVIAREMTVTKDALPKPEHGRSRDKRLQQLTNETSRLEKELHELRKDRERLISRCKELEQTLSRAFENLAVLQERIEGTPRNRAVQGLAELSQEDKAVLARLVNLEGAEARRGPRSAEQ